MKAINPIGILLGILVSGCASYTPISSNWSGASEEIESFRCELNNSTTNYLYVNEGRYRVQNQSSIEASEFQRGIILLSKDELQIASLDPNQSNPKVYTTIPIESMSFARLFFPETSEWAGSIIASHTLEVRTDSETIFIRIEDPRYKHDLGALYSRLLDTGVRNYGTVENKAKPKGYYSKRYEKQWRERARMRAGVPPLEDTIKGSVVIAVNAIGMMAGAYPVATYDGLERMLQDPPKEVRMDYPVRVSSPPPLASNAP